MEFHLALCAEPSPQTTPGVRQLNYKYANITIKQYIGSVPPRPDGSEIY